MASRWARSAAPKIVPASAHGQRHDAVFGFNHYLPDYAVATALWEHAAAWAQARDLDTLFGPFQSRL